MNKPEYIVVDEVGAVVDAVRTDPILVLPGGVLNYQYGYVRELNETLKQWAETTEHALKKFPLIWLEQPFNIVRGESAAYYGRIEVMRVFIMMQTDGNYKAADRMANIYKTTLYPLYREFLRRLTLTTAFSTNVLEKIRHTVQDRYFWGEGQASVLDDKVDCMILTIRDLQIQNNLNCIPKNI